MRLTKKRQLILDVLKKHPGSLSAADIHKRVPNADLVTVYRNLDLFVQEKLIKQINIGTDEAQYEFQHHPHHHAICANCGKVIHFEASEEKLKKILKVSGFTIDDIEVTLKGSCRAERHRK